MSSQSKKKIKKEINKKIPILGFISDAHGNLGALMRGIKILKKYGAKNLIFLGDGVGYIPNLDVIKFIKKQKIFLFCIQGNHENLILKNKNRFLKPDIKNHYKISKILDSRTRTFISKWPKKKTLNLKNKKILLIHGSPVDPTFGYVYPNTRLNQFTPKVNWVFLANTHYPFIRHCQGVNYVNIGSCGMPRDHGKLGSVAIMDAEKNKAKILRFYIGDLLKKIYKKYPDVHTSVKKLSNRTKKNFVGTLCSHAF